MCDALKMAVEYGFRFDEGDFAEIKNNFRPGYWMYPDSVYRAAITGGKSGKHAYDIGALYATPHNMSAVKSMEAHGYPSWLLRGHRLYVGAKLKWIEAADLKKIEKAGKHPSACFQDRFFGLHVQVTSISSERVILSHYGNEKSRKPTRIIKVTREVLAAQNELLKPPAKKRAKKAA